MSEWRARLCVVSSITDDTGSIQEEKRAASCLVIHEEDALILRYAERRDGQNLHVQLTVQGKRAVLERETLGTLRFCEGGRATGELCTEIGAFAVETQTSALTLEETEAGGALRLAYAITLAGEPNGEARATWTWRF